jgi:isftu1 transposase
MEQIAAIASEKLVFCDEMGVDDNITPLYGWSKQGVRSYGERAGYKKQRVSIVAAYQHGIKKLIAPMEYSGYTNTSLFVQWVEEHLCPNLKKGQYVIMDNVSFHKSIKVKEAIEKVGCKLIYLPVYSPDLNPIEHCWANFKNYLRKIIKKCKNIHTAISIAMAKTFPC